MVELPKLVMDIDLDLLPLRTLKSEKFVGTGLQNSLELRNDGHTNETPCLDLREISVRTCLLHRI